MIKFQHPFTFIVNWKAKKELNEENIEEVMKCFENMFRAYIRKNQVNSIKKGVA